MKTHITMVLDSSGSMQKIANDTIGGVNKFIEAQQKVKGEATFTLVTFNITHKTVYDTIDIKEVKPLDHTTFIPNNGTALLDALSHTIDDTGNYLRNLSDKKRPINVVFVIVTDGEENSSKKATREQVFDKISHQKNKYNWQFIFLGANQDAIHEAAKIGIPQWYTLNYAATEKGISNTYQIASSNVTRSRSGGGASAFTDLERQEALDK